jgi:hypothetical protein
MFSSTLASSVQVVNTNTIRCVTAAEAVGTVHVTVQGSDNQAVTAPSAPKFFRTRVLAGPLRAFPSKALPSDQITVQREAVR